MSATKPCEHCRKDFTPHHWFQRFCDSLCRRRWHRQEEKRKLAEWINKEMEKE